MGQTFTSEKDTSFKVVEKHCAQGRVLVMVFAVGFFDEQSLQRFANLLVFVHLASSVSSESRVRVYVSQSLHCSLVVALITAGADVFVVSPEPTGINAFRFSDRIIAEENIQSHFQPHTISVDNKDSLRFLTDMRFYIQSKNARFGNDPVCHTTSMMNLIY